MISLLIKNQAHFMKALFGKWDIRQSKKPKVALRAYATTKMTHLERRLKVRVSALTFLCLLVQCMLTLL